MFPRLTLACPVCSSLQSLWLQLLFHPPSNALKHSTSICICLGTIHSAWFITAAVHKPSCCRYPLTHAHICKFQYFQRHIHKTASVRWFFFASFNLCWLRYIFFKKYSYWMHHSLWAVRGRVRWQSWLVSQQYCYKTRGEMHLPQEGYINSV